MCRTEVCPLSRVQAGAVVCIKRLATAPEVTDRLRELGLCEEQRIKLLARQSTYICQVCNARLAISGQAGGLDHGGSRAGGAPGGVSRAGAETSKLCLPVLQPLTSVALGAKATVVEIKLPPESRPGSWRWAAGGHIG